MMLHVYFNSKYAIDFLKIIFVNYSLTFLKKQLGGGNQNALLLS